MRLHAPSHHMAAEPVNHRGLVQPTLVGGDVGDVVRPGLVGGCRGEVVLYQVKGNGQMVLAMRGKDKLVVCTWHGCRATASSGVPALCPSDVAGHHQLCRKAGSLRRHTGLRECREGSARQQGRAMCSNALSSAGLWHTLNPQKQTVAPDSTPAAQTSAKNSAIRFF